jgi:hypothetical protein
MSNASFSVRVYGEVNQNAPYLPDSVGNLAAVSATYSETAALVTNFPSASVNIFPIADPGCVMRGVSCYGVIEIPATGLNQFGKKYVVQQTVATLATLRNT